MGRGGTQPTSSKTAKSRSWQGEVERARSVAIHYSVRAKRTALTTMWDLAAKAAKPPLHLRRRDLPMDVLRVNVFEDVVVEPKYGWVIAEPYILVEDSMTYGRRIRTWAGREWVGVPSPFAYRSGRRSAQHIEEAISLCSFWPENFYHFSVEVMAKLQVCIDSPDIDHTLPILINAELAERSFFQQASNRGALANLNFVPVGEKYVHVGKLTTIAGEPGELPESIDFPRLRRLIGASEASEGPDRIFITRAPERGRVPFNLREVEALFESHGFTIYDLDHESLDSQVSLFQSASKIAAIHGAALANLVWTDPADTSMMELIPRTNDDELDAFVALTRAMGMGYTSLRCGDPTEYTHKRASFPVDLDALEKVVSEFVG